MFASRMGARSGVAGVRPATTRTRATLAGLCGRAAQSAVAALTTTVSSLAFAGIVCTGAVAPDPSCPSATVSGTLFVGTAAPGTLAVDAGTTLTANTLSVATGGTGIGTVTITGTTSGPQTVINLLGPPNGSTTNNPLEIGNWGTGTMTVLNGAIINGGISAGVPNSNCVPSLCNIFIGQIAGSSGTLTLTGAGTTASFAGGFFVGNSAVFTTAAGDPSDFGTPGGTSTGIVNVTNGAVLNTYSGSLANIFATAASLGTEHAVAHVTVDGANSVWNVTQNPVTGFTAGISMASAPNATATLDVTHGGQVAITGANSYLVVGDGGGATVTIASGGQIGVTNLALGQQPTGVGTVTVGGGVGQSVVTASNSIGVGNSSTALSQLTVNAGGLVNVTGSGGIGIAGSAGSQGKVLVDGGQLNVNGAGSSLGVGNGGTGTLIIQNGGTVSAVNLAIGNQTTAVGNVTVGNGSGSSVLTVSNSMGVGNQSTANSQLTINSGGTVDVTGAGGLGIAGSAGSHGTVLVDGGALNINAPNAFFGVGNGGNGTLTIQNGGNVSAVNLGLGGSAGSVGTVTVGNGSGASVLTVSNSMGVGNQSTATSQLIVNQGGSVQAGGSGIGIANSAGSNGSVLVDGGLVTVSGSTSGFGIGNTGTGALTIRNSGQVVMAGQNFGMTVGGQGTGSLSVNTGGSLTTESLTIAGGLNSTGVATIVGTSSGPQTVITLNGPASSSNGVNVLQVGNWGNGTMTVSGGAIVNAAVGNANCGVTFCGNYVGNGAGATGSLTLTDTGTTMNLGGPFIVGNAVVFTNPPNNFAFGTPGGTTTATVSVQNGATLNTYTATISQGPTGPNATGSEHTNAHIIIDGPGSSWNVTSDPLNPGNAQAFIGISSRANATATIDITNGGKLTVSGSGSNPQPQMNMTGGGQAGGSSTVHVDGAGSAIVFNGDTGLIQVGRNGGTAELDITNGGRAYGGGANGLAFMNVGRVGSDASLTVDGAGSALTLSGVSSAVNGNTSGAGAFMTIGRDTGGVGHASVTNGALLYINDGGQAANNGSTGLRLGRDANSTGIMMVSGLGTQVIVEQTGSGTSTPTIFVGQAGNGQMTITDHATVVVNGPSQRDFIVGNAGGGQGTLTVSNNAQLTASWFGVGNNGGTGMATIDNATVLLNGVAINPADSSLFGGSVRVGRATGSVGTLNLVNGAQIILNSPTDNASINLGGTSTALGGDGTLNMSGASSISFIGTGATPAVNIGHSGTGLFTMTGGSTLSMPNDGIIVLGNRASGNGTLQLGGGSTIDTGFLDVGNNGRGSVVMTGGTFNIHARESFVVGANTGSVGTFAQSGGVVNAAGELGIGQQSGSSGTYTLSGGTLNSGNVTVGDRGTGVFVSSAPVSVSTIHNAAGNIAVGVDTSSNGSYTITGNNAQTNVNFAPGGVGPTDPPGLNGVDPVTLTNRPAPNGALGVGVGGIGTFTQGAANASDPGNVVAVAGDLAVGVFAGGQGTYTLNTGTLTVGGKIVIGGQSQSANVFTQNGGSVTVTGAAFGNLDYVGLGGNEFSGSLIVGGGINDLGGGTGTYVVNGGTVTASALQVGHTGTGTFNQTGGLTTVTGNVVIGDAGVGTFTQNGGAHTIGGELILGNQTTGNGTYIASNGASVVLTGTSATARVVVGNEGTGALTVEGGGTVSLPGNGSIIVGATATGTGTVFVTGGSSIQAGSLLGIGYDGSGSTGGRATVIIDDPASSITALTVTIGAGGCLGGNGVVHGNVVMDGDTANVGACPPAPNTLILAGPTGVSPFGILNPGRSPGRLVIDGGFNFISGTIVLEVLEDTPGHFIFDELVFSDAAPINLTVANIEFSFLGNTDPNAFESSGLWDLDTFFKVNTSPGFGAGADQAISGALGETLDNLFAQSSFEATSDAFLIENFTFTPEGGVGESFVAVPVASVPEPPPWMLLLAAMLPLYIARMRRLAAIKPRR